MLQNQGSWRIPRLWRTNTEKRKAADSNARKQLVSEKLWPSTLDHECYKAALILRSFSQDGLLEDVPKQPAEAKSPALAAPTKPLKIPPEIIRSAKGLVVCSIMRAGLWEFGAGGSGVAVARLEDGSWSCPAAIEVKTAEIGVVVGVDLMDCVLVLNTAKGVDMIKNGRCFIGGDLYAVPGPFNISWFLESDARSRAAPVFTYLRSQQYSAEATLDNSTFINERLQENEDFYSPQKISASDILMGKVRSPPSTIAGFRQTVKAAQGDADADLKMIPTGPPPSDFKVVEEGHTFGLPDIEDPDPYGALALEKHGLGLRDASTKKTAAPEHFDFSPSLTSPVHERYYRRGGDASSVGGSRSSWRASTFGALDRYEDRASVLSIRSGPGSPPGSSIGLPSPGSRRYATIDEQEPNIEHAPNGLFSSGEPDEGGVDDTLNDAEDAMSYEVARSTGDGEGALSVDGAMDTRDGHEATESMSEVPDGKDEDSIHETASSNGLSARKDEHGPFVAQHDGHDDKGAESRSLADEPTSETRNDQDSDLQESPPNDGYDSDDGHGSSDLGDSDPDEEFEVFDGNQAVVGAATLAVTRPQVVQVKSLPLPPLLPSRNVARVSANSDGVPDSTPGPGVNGNEKAAGGSLAINARSSANNADSKSEPRSEGISEALSPVEPTTDSEAQRSVSPVDSVNEEPSGDFKNTISENRPDFPANSLASIRKGLEFSPSPEESPDETAGSYFK